MYSLAFTGLTMLPYVIAGTVLLGTAVVNLARRRRAE
jgi:hypothetical protein